MTDTITKPRIKDETKVERPRLHKVILVNDDFTPRVRRHCSEGGISPERVDQALRVMMTAHRRGACVVAFYTKDVAEAKATNATDDGRRKGNRRNSPQESASGVGRTPNATKSPGRGGDSCALRFAVLTGGFGRRGLGRFR